MQRMRWAGVVCWMAMLPACGIQDAPVRARDDQALLPTGVEGLVLISGDGQTAEAGAKLENLVALVRDAAGNAKVGATVEFKIVAGNGSVGGTQFTSDKDGYVAAAFQLATSVGPATIRATLLPDEAGDPNRNVYFNVVAVVGAPDYYSMISGSTCVAMESSTDWSLKLCDKYGNGISGGSVTVTPTGVQINGSTAPVQVPVNAGGLIKFKVQAPAAPDYNARIRVDGPSGKQYFADITVGARLWFKSLSGTTITTTGPARIFTPTVQLLEGACVPVVDWQIQSWYTYPGSTNRFCEAFPARTDSTGKYTPTCNSSAAPGNDYVYNVRADKDGQTAMLQFVHSAR